MSGHSLPGDGRGRDLSGHIKNTTEYVRTHFLETTGRGTCQDTERNRPIERHSLPADGGRDLSGLRKKSTGRGALTPWRRKGERLIRTWKEIDRSRGTHVLERAEGGDHQDTERNQRSERHSRPGDGEGWDWSGHRKKSTERGALTLWRRRREGLVRTRKEIDGSSSRGTHSLETAGGTCQDIERNRLREGHSLPEDGREMDLSRHGKKSTKQGSLTPWRRQREGVVRIRKEINRARGTYSLEMAEDGTYQDMDRKRERGALTTCR